MKRLIPLLLCLFALPAFGQIAELDTVTTGTTTLAKSVSAGSNRLLVARITAADNGAGGSPLQITGVTYGDQNMVEACQSAGNPGGTNTDVSGIFVLNDAGITAASGTTITPSMSSALDDIIIAASSYTGVDQTTPVSECQDGQVAGSNTVSVDTALTVTSGNWVLGVSGASIQGNTVTWSNMTEDGSEVSATTSVLSVAENTGASGSLTPSGTWTTTQRLTIAAAEIGAAASGPEFSVAPALSDCDDTGCDFTYTDAGTGNTVYGMFVVDGASAPTCAAIQAETGSHGANSDTTDGTSQTLALTATDTPEFQIYDAYFCLDDGANESSVESVLANTLDAPTGFQWSTTITSIGSGSPCESFNSGNGAGADIAANDYLLAPSQTTPGTGGSAHDLTISAACQFSYNDGGAGFQQSASGIFIYDDGANDWNADQMSFVANNNAPVCVDSPTVIVLEFEPFSLDMETLVTDADGDTLTITTMSSLPNNTTLSMNTWASSPDPDTEDESGTALVFDVADEWGATCEIDVLSYVVDTVTVPTLTDGDLSDAINDELASFPWRDDPTLSATFACNDMVASGDVISQDPAAMTEVAYDQALSVVVSLGVCGGRNSGSGGPVRQIRLQI